MIKNKNKLKSGYHVERELMPIEVKKYHIGQVRTSHYNAYKDGILVAEDVSYHKCAEISGWSESTVRHKARTKQPTKDGWIFIKVK